jgi:hypothetical protein
MVTCVPYDEAFIYYASSIFALLRPPHLSLSCMFNDGLRLHERLMFSFGSYAHRRVSNHKIGRSVCGLMHVKVNCV